MKPEQQVNAVPSPGSRKKRAPRSGRRAQECPQGPGGIIDWGVLFGDGRRAASDHSQREADDGR